MLTVRVAKLDELAEGRMLRVDADGSPLLISLINGRLSAVEAICSHAGGRLEDGEIKDGCVVCPIHAAVFSLTTGKVSPETDWATDLKSFPVKLEGSDLLVELPSQAARDGSEPGVAPSSDDASDGGGHCAYSGIAK